MWSMDVTVAPLSVAICDSRCSSSLASPEICRVKLVRLRFERIEVASGGESEDVEASRHGAHDIQRLPADAAGRTEQDEIDR